MESPTTKAELDTDDETSGKSTSLQENSTLSDSEKLDHAFRRRHIRLRLHGTRLPEGYTLSLRLPSANDTSGKQPGKPRYKRQRRASPAKLEAEAETTDEDSRPYPATRARHVPNAAYLEDDESGEAQGASTASGGEEDEMIRANNAYPGSHNTIGSIHQRKWFMSLDKQNSGFTKSSGTGRWTRSEIQPGGWDAFFVKGRDYERSIVTGRLAADVMKDEKIEMYKGRKMWRPIME